MQDPLLFAGRMNCTPRNQSAMGPQSNNNGGIQNESARSRLECIKNFKTAYTKYQIRNGVPLHKEYCVTVQVLAPVNFSVKFLQSQHLENTDHQITSYLDPISWSLLTEVTETQVAF